MAAAAAPRKSSDDDSLGRVMSHGRGGAGNIGYDSDGYKESEDELRIPPLKSQVYTTGRGGTGNMAVNDPMHPENARAAQDVESLPMRSSSSEFHGGRGGAGNVVIPFDTDSELEREEEEKAKLAAQQHMLAHQNEEKVDYRGWADRGKDLLMLKLGRGKKQSSN